MVLGIVVMQVVGAVLVIVTLLALAMLTFAKFIVADVLGTGTGTVTESIWPGNFWHERCKHLASNELC